MKTYYDCIPCIVRQALDAVRQVTDDEELIEKVLRQSLELISQVDYDHSPAEISSRIHRLIREETGNDDPYLSLKKKANSVAKIVYRVARKVTAGSPNPFQMAVKYSIAGNILDFGVFTDWDKNRLRKSLGAVETTRIDSMGFCDLETKVHKADTILIIGDNAGEVVFDRLLLENMPKAKKYYAVKGKPVINDALREDAVFAGIDQYAEIISNGNDYPGTVLPECSDEFMEIFNNADLVIAKGQGNFETLNDCDREVFFLTQIKCPTVARDLKGKVGDWVVRTNYS